MQSIYIYTIHICYLPSLLNETEQNQLCEVLLHVCKYSCASFITVMYWDKCYQVDSTVHMHQNYYIEKIYMYM